MVNIYLLINAESDLLPVVKFCGQSCMIISMLCVTQLAAYDCIVHKIKASNWSLTKLMELQYTLNLLLLQSPSSENFAGN